MAPRTRRASGNDQPTEPTTDGATDQTTDGATDQTTDGATDQTTDGATTPELPAMPAGYEMRQDHGAFSLWARADGAPDVQVVTNLGDQVVADVTNPAWIVRCTAHGTMIAATDATNDGRGKGRAAVRATWCEGCANGAPSNGNGATSAPAPAGSIAVSVRLTVMVDREKWANWTPEGESGEGKKSQAEVYAALLAAGIDEPTARLAAARATVVGEKSAADIRSEVRDHVRLTVMEDPRIAATATEVTPA